MKHLIPEFDQLRARFPKGFDSSMTLPCLRRIQEDRGYVADSDIAELAAYLGVPRIQIEEVLSFYTQFRRAPVGRCHIEMCRNVSCSLLGAERRLRRSNGRRAAGWRRPARYTCRPKVGCSTIRWSWSWRARPGWCSLRSATVFFSGRRLPSPHPLS